MAMQPVLDLNTLIERPKIRIDGVPYELFSIDELSILDSQRLAGWGKEIEALAKAEDDGSTGDTYIEGGPAFLQTLNNARTKGQKVSAEIAIVFDGLPSRTAVA